MIDIVAQRKGSVYYPFSDEDRQAGLVFPENMPLRIKVSGAKKARSYIHLCCYFGSCQYISEQNFNQNMNTKAKVDHLTRIRLGFVEDTIVLPDGSVQWLVKSLSYDNCDHPEAVDFINGALEHHAELMGVEAGRYVQYLRSRG